MKYIVYLMFFVSCFYAFTQNEHTNVLRDIVQKEGDSNTYLEIYNKKEGINSFHKLHPDWSQSRALEHILRFRKHTDFKELKIAFQTEQQGVSAIVINLAPNQSEIKALYFLSNGAILTDTSLAPNSNTHQLVIDTPQIINTTFHNISLSLEPEQRSQPISFENNPQRDLVYMTDVKIQPASKYQSLRLSEAGLIYKEPASLKLAQLKIKSIGSNLSGELMVSRALSQSFGSELFNHIIQQAFQNKLPISFLLTKDMQIQSLTLHNWYQVNPKISFERLELRADGSIKVWKISHPNGVVTRKENLKRLFLGCEGFFR